MSKRFQTFLIATVSDYIDEARDAFNKRLDSWKVDIFEREMNDVVGGLLARQVSLATTIAHSPPIWNLHCLPVVLRCMADVYITFSWILRDPKPRSRQFIEYGLGQEKLAIEKYQEALAGEPNPPPEGARLIAEREQLLDAERYRFLIPVNLGAGAT